MLGLAVLPSTIYKHEGLLKGLAIMNDLGVAGMTFYLGDDSKGLKVPPVPKRVWGGVWCRVASFPWGSGDHQVHLEARAAGWAWIGCRC